MRTIMPRGMQHVHYPKYRNKATFIDGLRFDSRLEARRYEVLKLLQSAGEVLWFVRHPSFDLGGGVRYIADFLVTWATPYAMAKHYGEGEWPGVTVEDTKGVETAAFKIKKRLMGERYPNVRLVVMRKSRR